MAQSSSWDVPMLFSQITPLSHFGDLNLGLISFNQFELSEACTKLAGCGMMDMIHRGSLHIWITVLCQMQVLQIFLFHFLDDVFW